MRKLTVFLIALVVAVSVFTEPGRAQVASSQWTCGVNAVAASLTQCQAAPVAPLALRVDALYVQTTTTTSGTYALQYGTSTSCGTGTTPIFPVSGTGSNRFNAPITTSAMGVVLFPVPLSIPAGNALCLIGVATNTISAQIVGHTVTAP